MNSHTTRMIALLFPLVLAGCPPATRTPGTDVSQNPEDVSELVTDVPPVECTGDIECPTHGVCLGKVFPRCVEGQWQCDFAAATDYEEEETSCNGKDNDCDGVEDGAEVFKNVKPSDACPGGLTGVCADADENNIAVVCAQGVDNQWEFQCNFANVLDYVADERFTLTDRDLFCDNLDNDCDGETDEFFEYSGDLDAAAFEALTFDECPVFQGVCEVTVNEGEPQVDWAFTGNTLFRCNAGVFECAVDQIEEYDAIESHCDSLDNDCDGKTDEEMEPALSPCLSKGVCEGKVEAVCLNGEWYCIYDEVLKDGNFQYVDPDACIGDPDPLCGGEKLCDGLDNDCDGQTDEGLSWPYYPEICDDEVDNNSNGKKDCEEDLCAQYHPHCAGSTPPVFIDCPVLTTKIINGVSTKIPVLGENALPVLPGICAPDDLTGVSPVHLQCAALTIGNQPAGAIYKCNYDDVAKHVAEEKYVPGGDTSLCDGLDNDCDGTVDDPGEIVVTDNIAGTSCRFLGECNGNVAAHCNPEGLRPGQWSCEYNIKETKTVAVPEACNPDNSNCMWEELTCDGLDNDCDGVADEMLDGRRLEVETACGSIMGKGVCIPDLLDTKCEAVGVGQRAFVCDTSNLTLYQATEEMDLLLCDSKDNDCDGEVDEGIVASDPNDIESYTLGCLYKGVCSVGTVCTCTNGTWIPNYAQVASFGAGYSFKPALSDTYVEVACDGKDNDCDGLVDEDLNLDLEAAGAHNPKLKSGCPLKGVCQGTIKWGCSDGGWFCDTTAVTAYEPTETKCDGKDNDCDGLVDETLTNIVDANCKNKGVCSGPGVTATCSGGQYLCYYTGVQSYEEAKETLCDGKDNDCDGTADEDLDWEAVSACNRKGVCSSDQLDALCLGQSGWDCLYEVIPDYQASPESRCDQKDNDCDNQVDEAACAVCQMCTQPVNCISGACNTTPLGTAKYCSSSANVCVYVDPYTGLCTSVADGVSVCGTTTKAYLCAMGTWYGNNTPECTGASPVCVQGACKACVPLAMRCSGNTIQKCAADGSGWNSQGTCTASEVCLGKGVCVTNSEFLVSPSTAATITLDNSPKVAGRKTGGFVVVYETDSFAAGDATDVLMRLYNANMQPVGDVVLVNTYTDGFQGAPDVAGFTSDTGGYVVVWESADQDGASWGVYGQRYSETGDKVGSEFLVNTTTVSDQKRPSVAAAPDGSFLVAWESSSGADLDSYGVYARRFDANGVPFGNEVLINTTQTNLQTNAEVVARSTVGWLAAWSSANQDGANYASVAQLYNTTLAKVGVEFVTNTYTTDAQRNPVVGAFSADRAGYSVIVWESSGQDGFGTGVFMQYYGASGDALLLTGEKQVNTVVLGNQKDPAVAVLDSNGVVVVWESLNLSGETAGTSGVAARLFDSTATAINANEWLVNQTVAAEQNNPDVASIGDKGYVVVWSSYTQIPAALSIYGRVFKAP